MENSAGPTTYKNTDHQTISQSSKSQGRWFRGNLFRIIIAILIIGVLAEVVFGGYTLFAPAGSRNINLNPIQSQAKEIGPAHLSLVSDRSSYKKGETVAIDVKLFTGGYITDSTDLVIKYDPGFLKPQGKDFAVAGQIYSEYPSIQLDDKNGLIGISGITPPGKVSFSGVGSFAKMNFTALKDGETELQIDYKPDLTSDSNVVLSGTSEDVLGEVANLKLTISDTNQTVVDSSTKTSCQNFNQSCQTSSGQTGSQSCSAGSMNNNVCGYDPKLTVSCGECK